MSTASQRNAEEVGANDSPLRRQAKTLHEVVLGCVRHISQKRTTGVHVSTRAAPRSAPGLRRKAARTNGTLPSIE